MGMLALRPYLIPEASRFSFADLVLEHWAHRQSLEPWLDQRWAWLAAHDYHLWFAAAVLPGVIVVSTVQGVDRHTPWRVAHAPLGWLAGAAFGYVLYDSLRAESWPLAVMMPATFSFIAGALGGRLRVRVGSSGDFVTMLATARIAELKELCAGTPSARHFEEGGERMLASILGTLAPGGRASSTDCRDRRGSFFGTSVDPRRHGFAMDAFYRQSGGGAQGADFVLDEHRYPRDTVV